MRQDLAGKHARKVVLVSSRDIQHCGDWRLYSAFEAFPTYKRSFDKTYQADINLYLTEGGSSTKWKGWLKSKAAGHRPRSRGFAHASKFALPCAPPASLHRRGLPPTRASPFNPYGSQICHILLRQQVRSFSSIWSVCKEWEQRREGGRTGGQNNVRSMRIVASL